MEEDEVLEEGVFERGNSSSDRGLRNGREEDDEVLEEGDFERKSGEEAVTPRDAVKVMGEIYGEYKKAYKSASKSDKAKFLLIILPILITLALGFVGIFIANMGQALELKTVEIIGLVIMGIGLGGFVLTLVLIIVISKLKGRK